MPEMAKILKTCYNCLNYGWKQTDDKSTIKQCNRCKLAFYCSKQCQKEHWHKLHKKQCKYLAEVKVLPLSKHDEAACLMCKGAKDVSQPGSPVLPCTLSVAHQAMMKTRMSFDLLAFPLPEMSGKFPTKAEATVTIMMQILLKMKLVWHPGWMINTKLAEEQYRVLSDAR